MELNLFLFNNSVQELEKLFSGFNYDNRLFLTLSDFSPIITLAIGTNLFFIYSRSEDGYLQVIFKNLLQNFNIIEDRDNSSGKLLEVMPSLEKFRGTTHLSDDNFNKYKEGIQALQKWDYLKQELPRFLVEVSLLPLVYSIALLFSASLKASETKTIFFTLFYVSSLVYVTQWINWLSLNHDLKVTTVFPIKKLVPFCIGVLSTSLFTQSLLKEYWIIILCVAPFFNLLSLYLYSVNVISPLGEKITRTKEIYDKINHIVYSNTTEEGTKSISNVKIEEISKKQL